MEALVCDTCYFRDRCDLRTLPDIPQPVQGRGDPSDQGVLWGEAVFWADAEGHVDAVLKGPDGTLETEYGYGLEPAQADWRELARQHVVGDPESCLSVALAR